MFGSPPSAPLSYGQSLIFSMENGDAPSFKQSMEPLSGIYGRAVQQQNPALYFDVENERDVRMENTLQKGDCHKDELSENA